MGLPRRRSQLPHGWLYYIQCTNAVETPVRFWRIPPGRKVKESAVFRCLSNVSPRPESGRGTTLLVCCRRCSLRRSGTSSRRPGEVAWSCSSVMVISGHFVTINWQWNREQLKDRRDRMKTLPTLATASRKHLQPQPHPRGNSGQARRPGRRGYGLR